MLVAIALQIAGCATMEVHTFRVPTLSGSEFDLAAVRGRRPAVIVFWAAWCVPCLDEARHLVELHREVGDRVEFLAVSVDEPEERGLVREVAAELGIVFPIGLDPDGRVLALHRPSQTVPLTLVLDASGELAWFSTDFESADAEALRCAVRQVAADAGSP